MMTCKIEIFMQKYTTLTESGETSLSIIHF